MTRSSKTLANHDLQKEKISFYFYLLLGWRQHKVKTFKSIFFKLTLLNWKLTILMCTVWVTITLKSASFYHSWDNIKYQNSTKKKKNDWVIQALRKKLFV